nr:amino acid decarboxylase [uncultured Oscillibacter sp.]
MTTPIWDFLQRCQQAGTRRFHMPGHKGAGPLGCEQWDITEIQGADSLYEAAGIIAESEANAAALFGSGATFYSTEGSSQCIKVMLYLALQNRPAGTPPVIAAARNVHKSFVHAAALLDFEPVWLWPEESASLCACPVTAEGLGQVLSALDAPPAAVYITSPDYLGNMADIPALAGVCRRYKTPLLVDNAHGAYLRFLEPSRHPLDLGADLCCDSAHKTLPVLTGGAYLHIAKTAPAAFRKNARAAMALFGSTSPSYLTLASLDLCNGYLAGGGPSLIRAAAGRMEALKQDLPKWGWSSVGTEPLKLTLDTAACGITGSLAAEGLRVNEGVEPEYGDPDFVVLMASGATGEADFQAVERALRLTRRRHPRSRPALPLARGERVLSIREALFAPQETVPAEESLGRICGAPTVSCPPAVPIAVSGERIGPEAAALFPYYGIKTVDVLQD